MESVILDTVIPLLIIFGFAFILTRIGIHTLKDVDGLNKFVFYAGIPALCLTIFSTGTLDFRVFNAYLIVKAILFVFDLVVLLIIKKGKFDERYFLAAWLPSVWSNNLILGIPMLSAFYDPTTVQSVCLLSAIPDFFPQFVVVLIIYNVGTSLRGGNASSKRSVQFIVWSIVVRSVTHPFMVVTIVGLIINLSSLYAGFAEWALDTKLVVVDPGGHNL